MPGSTTRTARGSRSARTSTTSRSSTRRRTPGSTTGCSTGAGSTRVSPTRMRPRPSARSASSPRAARLPADRPVGVPARRVAAPRADRRRPGPGPRAVRLRDLVPGRPADRHPGGRRRDAPGAGRGGEPRDRLRRGGARGAHARRARLAGVPRLPRGAGALDATRHRSSACTSPPRATSTTWPRGRRRATPTRGSSPTGGAGSRRTPSARRWPAGTSRAASRAMATAESVLDLRDRIAVAGAPAGLVAPDALRTAYEGADPTWPASRPRPRPTSRPRPRSRRQLRGSPRRATR